VYLWKNLKFGLRNRKAIQWEGSMMIEAVAVFLALAIAFYIFAALMSTSGSGTSCQESQFLNFASSLVADVRGEQGGGIC
jgi:hypothetical protein